jgi:hypothetical protein
MSTTAKRFTKAALVIVASAAVVLGGTTNASAATRVIKSDSSTASYVAKTFRADRKVSPAEKQASCLTQAAKTWSKQSAMKGKWTANPSSSIVRTCGVGPVTAVRYSGTASKTALAKSLRKNAAYKSSLKSKKRSLYGTGAHFDKKSKVKKVVLFIAETKPTKPKSPAVTLYTPPVPAQPTASPKPTSTPKPSATPTPVVTTPAPQPTATEPTPTATTPAPEPTVIEPTTPAPTEPTPVETTPAPEPTVTEPTTPPPSPEPVYVAPVRETSIEADIKSELVKQMGAPREEGDVYEFTEGNQCLEDTVTNWGLATGADQDKGKTFYSNSFFNNTACQYDFAQGMVIRSNKSNAADIVEEWLTPGTVNGDGQVTGGGLGAKSAFSAYLLNGSGDLAVSTYTDFRGVTWTYLIAGRADSNATNRLTEHQSAVLNDEMHRLINEYRVASGKTSLTRTECLDQFAEGARVKAGTHGLTGGMWNIVSMGHRNAMAPCPVGNDAEVLTQISLYDYEPTDEYALGLAARAMDNFKKSDRHNRAMLMDNATDNGVASFNPDFAGSVFVVMEPSSN